jgi:hypothetical protein
MNSEIIYSYSREQAIEDGVLINIPLAKEAGFKFPVAVTSAVWTIINKISKDSYQDVNGRTWDVLNMLKWATKNNGSGSIINFSLIMQHGKKRTLFLKAVCGPNDDMTPCITIMLPNED